MPGFWKRSGVDFVAGGSLLISSFRDRNETPLGGAAKPELAGIISNRLVALIDETKGKETRPTIKLWRERA
jgi:hypothetical protein